MIPINTLSVLDVALSPALVPNRTFEADVSPIKRPGFIPSPVCKTKLLPEIPAPFAERVSELIVPILKIPPPAIVVQLAVVPSVVRYLPAFPVLARLIEPP